MKNLLILCFTIVPLFLKAQVYQTIEPIEGRGEIEQGVYYKDMNNVLNGFEGTYEYNSGGFYFKIVLKKIFSNLDYFCEDVLVGTYKYVVNGVEYNYLDDSLIGLTDDTQCKISLNIIHPAPQPSFCPDCLPEKWLMGGINAPLTNKSAWFYMAKKVQNGEQGIQVWMYLEAATQQPGEPDDPVQLPISDFFFMKKID